MYVIVSNQWSNVFWNNELGWVNLDLATRFTEVEATKLDPPIGGVWISLWEVMGMRFAHLITELASAGLLSDDVVSMVADQMQVGDEDVDEIINQARNHWDAAKESV